MNNKVINEKLVVAPIETIIKVNENEVNALFPDIYNSLKIELYCPICKEKRVFTCVSHDKLGYDLNQSVLVRNKSVLTKGNMLIIYKFCCEFGHNFKMIMETLGQGELIKIGQFPSPMFLSNKINKDIFKILDEKEKQYYLLSVKSHNNNLNIASFLYLRRVFESLIEKAIKKTTTNFEGMKTKEKIKQLVKEGLLNDLLKNNGYNVLYTLLSDGVHNLTEEQCQEQYELLKSAVEIILEDEIYIRNLEKRKISIGNLLSNKNSEK